MANVKQESGLGVTKPTKSRSNGSYGSHGSNGATGPNGHKLPKGSKKATGKRKFHRKSRNGCAVCKRRRVKCDEGHPVCGNCRRIGLQCHYDHPVEAQQHELEHSQEHEHVTGSDEHHPSSGGGSRSGSEAAQGMVPPADVKEAASPVFPSSSVMSSPINLMSSAMGQSVSVGMDRVPSYGMSSLLNPNVLGMAASVLGTTPTTPGGTPTTPLTAAVAAAAAATTTQSSAPQQSLPLQSAPSITTTPMSPLLVASGLSPNVSTAVGHNNSGGPTPTPQQLAAKYQNHRSAVTAEFASATTGRAPVQAKPNGSNVVPTPVLSSTGAAPSLSPDFINSPAPPITGSIADLNLLDLRLMYHYTTKVWPTITAAGISDSKIWSDDIPMLAFKYPFLMHSLLAFSATHLSRTERGLDQCVTGHRAEALRLLREAVLEMSPENTDALVAAALILIMDSLANASSPTSTSLKSLPPSAWIFHVKGAATILTAVWPLSEKSRFYKFISVDLGDLGDIGYDMISGELSNTSDNALSATEAQDPTDDPPTSAPPRSRSGSIRRRMGPAGVRRYAGGKVRHSSIECFDTEISDLFPIPLDSPYFPTLAYMAKLHKERYKSDFILRIFAFPALLDKRFLGLLISCDLTSMRIMRCYYKLLRSFTEEMKDKVWFLEGVSSVLPIDVDQYSGGGGMHMMLDFLGGPSIVDDDGSGGNDVDRKAQQSGLLDTNNLPSSSIGDSLNLGDTSELDAEVNAAGDDPTAAGFISMDPD